MRRESGIFGRKSSVDATLDIGSDVLFKATMESTFFKMREEYFDTLFESLELSGKVYGLGPLSERLRDSIG